MQGGGGGGLCGGWVGLESLRGELEPDGRLGSVLLDGSERVKRSKGRSR